MNDPPLPRVAVLGPGDPTLPLPSLENMRLRGVIEALAASGVQPVPVVYADEAAGTLRERLLAMDGVLVWVNPIENGRDRSILDALLRDVAGLGVFVSTHPDVILKMGTKEVLYQTREMPWGTDTRLYCTPGEMRTRLPALLRSSGARVLKQNRGNGGNGVWKVELAEAAPTSANPAIRVQHALRGAAVETLPLGDFVQRCEPYFASSGCMLDQPFQARLAEGMIRAYLVQDRVAGFGFQRVTALMPPEPGHAVPPEPPARVYFGAAQPEFQPLRHLLESSWVAQMQRLLDLSRESLPIIWDADFLFGPKSATGQDTYVLCEINVSSVHPMPDEAFDPLANATREALRYRPRRGVDTGGI